MEGYENLANPVPGDLMEYNFTLRAALNGGINGTPGLIPADFSTGETFSQTFNYVVPDGYDINNFSLVAVVYDMNNDAAAYNAAINRIKCSNNNAFTTDIIFYY